MAEEKKIPEDEKLNTEQASGETAAAEEAPAKDAGRHKRPEKDSDKKSSGDFMRLMQEAVLRHPRRIAALAGLIVVVIILGGVFVSEGSKAAMSAYTAKKNEVSEETYDMFYGRIYDAAESAHHVSNDVTISIGSLQEENRLEVLKVTDVVYEITENEQQGGALSSIISRVFNPTVDSWLRVPGSGVYTVDMESAEFIIDNDHKYVLVRMMEPELTEFSIDYANVEELYFKDNAIFHNPARVGVDLVIDQLNSAERDLTDAITSNERFHDSSLNAAVNIVTGLVRELNQDLPDLTVEVEFVNGEK